MRVILDEVENLVPEDSEGVARFFGRSAHSESVMSIVIDTTMYENGSCAAWRTRSVVTGAASPTQNLIPVTSGAPRIVALQMREHAQ